MSNQYETMQTLIKTLSKKIDCKSPLLKAKLEAEHKNSYENLKWEYEEYKKDAKLMLAESKYDEPPSFLELS